MNILKKINYFIFSIIAFEIISLFSGFGTHFEHYKYAIMATIVILNSVAIKNIPKLSKVKNSLRKDVAND
tara:strand:+ start:98 stop:307 length:210 start_codon:yes stop_codon:yes gene_type:complete